jgi:hypothetical protein
MAQGTTYNRGPCPVCKRWISNAGFARSAHYRMHVRQGDMIEVAKWTWKGETLHKLVVPTSEREKWAGMGFTETFPGTK